MVIGFLSLTVLISGMLAIWFGYQQPPGGFYLFKPLTMVLIILIPVMGGGNLSIYKLLILGGLIFSAAGDIFLMLPKERFLAGLVAFLIAHLFYIAGFLIDQGSLIWWPALPVLVVTGIVGWNLKDGFGKLKVPVMIYMGVISAMVWLAWSRWCGIRGTGNLLALCGAALFMISDLILAVNRFKIEIKSARALDLLTYYTGQWLIALSVVGLDWLG